MLTLIDRSGPPSAQLCSTFLRDGCHEPIQGLNPRLALWRHDGYDAEARPIITKLVTPHKGSCALRLDPYSQELDQFVTQLAGNTIEPLEEEADVEYMAPVPSPWRLRRRHS